MTLGDFYRENGESDHCRRVEAALVDELASTAGVAERADVSPRFARKALDYLLEEGRVERVRVAGRAYRPYGWRWEWRRPG